MAKTYRGWLRASSLPLLEIRDGEGDRRGPLGIVLLASVASAVGSPERGPRATSLSVLRAWLRCQNLAGSRPWTGRRWCLPHVWRATAQWRHAGVALEPPGVVLAKHHGAAGTIAGMASALGGPKHWMRQCREPCCPAPQRAQLPASDQVEPPTALQPVAALSFRAPSAQHRGDCLLSGHGARQGFRRPP